MIIFEPQCKGIAHSKINASYILIYSKAYPSEIIQFFGEIEHISHVKEELLGCSINVKYIPIDVKNTNTNYFIWLISEFKNVFTVLQEAKRRRSNILFLSVTSFTLIATKLIRINSKIRIYIVVHGILESIIRKPIGILKKMYWFKNYLKFYNNLNIKYILLGDYIQNNALNIIPTLEKYTCSLELPYNLIKPEKTIEPEPNSKLIFASAGVASISKGSNHFFNLAKDILQNSTVKNIEFSYIGYFIDKRMNDFINNYVLLPSKDEPLDEINYKNYFLKVNFIILFYPPDSYKLTYSGVFLDAVKFEKPIIAIRNEFFTYYFDKYGDMGWLCDDYNDVLRLVTKLSVNVDAEELKKFNKNIQKLKSELSVDNLSVRLKKIII
jgi:hypothetical protein